MIGKGDHQPAGQGKQREAGVLPQPRQQEAPGLTGDKVELPHVQGKAHQAGPLGQQQAGGVAPFGAAAQMPQPEAEHDGCRHLDIKCQCKQEGRAVQGHGGEPVAQPAPQAGHQGQQQELPGLHRAPPFQKERGVSA